LFSDNGLTINKAIDKYLKWFAIHRVNPRKQKRNLERLKNKYKDFKVAAFTHEKAKKFADFLLTVENEQNKPLVSAV